MALTESTMMKLATQAPDFELPTTDGARISRAALQGKPLLVMFLCNHCPYVVHIAKALKDLTDQYEDQIGMVAIQSNDTQKYPADSFDKMKEEVVRRGYGFSYALDEDQSVAKAFTAACTPDFFLFDHDHRLVYRGRFDDTRPTRIASGVYDSSENPASGAELKAAMDAVLSQSEVSPKQFPSMGCNIKWKPGAEPNYFQ